METVCALLLSAVLLMFADGVSITDLTAPSMVKAGEELVLDCDFTYTEDEVNQLVVKWFFGGSVHPFYQWVPGLDMGPQIISSEFSDLVDLSYTVEGADKFAKFRALRIPSASLAIAGTYKCQVSSFTVEVAKETEVQVFVPPTSMSVVTTSSPSLDQDDRNSSASVTLSCMAGPTFPSPTLSLSWTQHLEPHTSTTPATITEQAGMFSAMLNVSIAGDSVGREDRVSCRLEIPGTGFVRTEETEMVEEVIYYDSTEDATDTETDTDYVPENFLGIVNNTEDATDRDDFTAPTDYDEQSEEPMNALERSDQALEENLPPPTASTGAVVLSPASTGAVVLSTAALSVLTLTLRLT